jgi:hypothetical protein
MLSREKRVASCAAGSMRQTARRLRRSRGTRESGLGADIKKSSNANTASRQRQGFKQQTWGGAWVQ